MSDERIETNVSEKEPVVKVSIVRNKDLVEILKSPTLTGKLILTVFLIVIFLFLGLTVVVVSVKRLFPYNTITTNPYGATLMKDEDKTVAYWLFNTSSLWADSGIEVKEGDVLTIRASGSMHTAIHHLVTDAAHNNKLRDPWMDTDGGREKSERNPDRERHRLAPLVDENVLLMRVLESNQETNPLQDTSETDSKTIYVIGKERTNLRIRSTGRLQFAVNDIVMTPGKIRTMYNEERVAYFQFIKDVFSEKSTMSIDTVKLFAQWKLYAREFFKNPYEPNEPEALKINSLKMDFKNPSYDVLNDFVNVYYKETKSYEKLCDDARKNKQPIPSRNGNPYLVLDSLIRNHGLQARPSDFEELDKLFPVINEYNYYYATNFKDAWYVDNIGSFLIVIEKRKPQ